MSPNAEDHRALAHLIRHTNWELHHAYDLHEAADLLTIVPVSVVLCEYQMPGGHWSQMASRAADMPVPPPIVVTSTHADDEMWSQVLDEGGYDCLLKPFRGEELYRIVSLAWRSWKHQHDRAQAQTAAMAAAV